MSNDLENLKKMLENGDIDKTHWSEHFPDLPDTRVPGCKDCLDLKKGTCRGGEDPVECFLYGSHSRPDGTLLRNEETDPGRGREKF